MSTIEIGVQFHLLTYAHVPLPRLVKLAPSPPAYVGAGSNTCGRGAGT